MRRVIEDIIRSKWKTTWHVRAEKLYRARPTNGRKFAKLSHFPARRMLPWMSAFRYFLSKFRSQGCVHKEVGFRFHHKIYPLHCDVCSRYGRTFSLLDLFALTLQAFVNYNFEIRNRYPFVCFGQNLSYPSWVSFNYIIFMRVGDFNHSQTMYSY